MKFASKFDLDTPFDSDRAGSSYFCSNQAKNI
jgi:hypothetical protein